MRRLLIGLLVVMGCIPILRAQEYSGVTGMIHVPTAEMATEGEARIGFFFLNQEFLPDTYQYEGEKFNTTNHFLAITPFPWIEIAYVCTILKGIDNDGHVGHNKKDRYFHLKVRPLKEGKHVMYRRNEFGFHLTYRYFTSDFNAKWRGIAAGITYRPSFARNLRATIEYTGDDINIGADCLLWKHLFLQATLQNGKHFTGGLCFKLNLLGKTHPD